MTQHDKVRACCGRCFDDSLQDFKRHVAAAVVTSDNTALATMTTANILQLFEIPQGGGGSSGSGTDGDALGGVAFPPPRPLARGMLKLKLKDDSVFLVNDLIRNGTHAE